MMLLSGVLLAAVCALVPLTRGLPWALAAGCFLVLATVLTLAELWQSAGSWGYSLALVPPGRRGSYLAFFSLGFTVATIAGPVLITTMLDLGLLGWLLLAAWFLAATAIISTLSTRVPDLVARH